MKKIPVHQAFHKLKEHKTIFYQEGSEIGGNTFRILSGIKDLDSTQNAQLDLFAKPIVFYTTEYSDRLEMPEPGVYILMPKNITMKEISLTQAINRLREGKEVFSDIGEENFKLFRAIRVVSILEDEQKYKLNMFVGSLFYEKSSNEPKIEPNINCSQAITRRDVTFEEAIKLYKEGRQVWFFKLDVRDWVPLTGNINLAELVSAKFQASYQARIITFDMVKKNPPASKRNAFEFQNKELDISIYGKKGIIPNSGKGIRVQITEIL